MLRQHQSNRRSERTQAPRGDHGVEIDLAELTDHTFLVSIRGRLSPEEAEGLLPRHAECIALDNGVAAIVHVRAERVAALLDRLGERRTEIGFSSPKAWVSGSGL